MRHFALISSLWLVGCFYVDPINQRPSLDIKQVSSTAVHRGDKGVMLEATGDDPEGQFIKFQWRIYICTDATAFETCDIDPIFTGIEPLAMFDIPTVRTGGIPVESLLVILEGTDDLGATARPAQQLIIPVLDHEPTLVPDKRSRYNFVVNTPVDLFVVYGDPDDTAQNVTVTWQAFSPSQVEILLTDIPAPAPDDPALLQVGKQLMPTATGTWDIKITATDPTGGTTVQHITVPVGDDTPPCLLQVAPIAPAFPVTLPVTEPTLFSVPLVGDDLDPYPTVPNDTFLGTTTFAWSMKVGAGTHQPLGVTGNSVAFDPAGFAPGSIVELRVEIFDRKTKLTSLSCPDGDQTCSIAATTCIQRQTWRVEVR